MTALRALVLTAAAAAAAATAAAWPAQAAAAPFTVGVCTHFSQQQMNTPAGRATVARLGIGSFRTGLYWPETEQRPGVYAFSPAATQFLSTPELAQLRPLLTLHRTNPLYTNSKKPVGAPVAEAFARFAAWAAQQLAARDPLFEIWNEWHLHDEPRTPEAYLELLRPVFRAVRAAAPNVKVLASPAGAEAIDRDWIDRFIRAGGLEACDGISLHPYIYGRWAPKNQPEFLHPWFRQRYEQWKRLHGGKDFDIYVTEVGWPMIPKLGLSPADQAALVLRTAAVLRGLPFVRGVWWYDLFDDGPDANDREHRFGLVTGSGQPKAGWYGLREAAWLGTAAGYRLHIPDPGQIDGVYVASGRVGADTVMMLWDTRVDGSKSSLRMDQDQVVHAVRLQPGSGDGDPFTKKQGRGLWTPLSPYPLILRGQFDPRRVRVRDGDKPVSLF